MIVKNKKKYFTIALITGAIIFGSTLSLKTQADPAPQPGTADDPVVTKSYVDQKIAALSGGGGSTGIGSDMSSIEIIQLQKGQTLWAKSGTEVIVRTGKTVAMSKDTNTIPDVTAGTDIKANTIIPNNHMLVFPNDTRGVRASDYNTSVCWLMVRGGYTIVDASGTVIKNQ